MLRQTILAFLLMTTLITPSHAGSIRIIPGNNGGFANTIHSVPNMSPQRQQAVIQSYNYANAYNACQVAPQIPCPNQPQHHNANYRLVRDISTGAEIAVDVTAVATLFWIASSP